MLSGIQKTLITTLLLAGTTVASANSGVIKFSGAISSSTCNINLSVNGVVSPTGVADLGVYKASDVSAIGEFGVPVSLALVPDLASCDVPPGGSDAMLNAATVNTDTSNTDVVITPDSQKTNVGVLFRLASGTPVLNQGGIMLTSGSTDLDDQGSIFFSAQPYALSATINPGVIGGTVSYTIAYL